MCAYMSVCMHVYAFVGMCICVDFLCVHMCVFLCFMCVFLCHLCACMHARLCILHVFTTCVYSMEGNLGSGKIW